MSIPVVLTILSCLLTISQTHILYSNGFPYTHYYPYGPYALGYSYFNAPYLYRHTYTTFLNDHHLVNNEKEDIKKDDQFDGKFSIAAAPTTLPRTETADNSEVDEATEIIEKASEEMPQTVGDLKYYTFNHPIVYTIPTPLTWPVANQFHRQDELGQYHYGYANEHSSKEELKTLDGITRGSYSYVDSNRRLQTVNYVSDALGFRVAATNLPKSPQPVYIPDSEAVRLAKLELFKAQHEALERLRIANLKDGVSSSSSDSSGVGVVDEWNEPNWK